MEDIRYKVVVNDEEQYALWIAGKSNAPGWRDTGFEGSKEDCLAHVREIWTDMRPLSLRNAMQCGAQSMQARAGTDRAFA